VKVAPPAGLGPFAANYALVMGTATAAATVGMVLIKAESVNAIIHIVALHASTALPMLTTILFAEFVQVL